MSNSIKRLEEYQQASLSGFQTNRADNYSHTIELYDAIPKYVWDGNRNRIEGSFLRALDREFVHKSHHYQVTVSPARLKDPDGIDRDYFPSQREELIEDALRKLASEGKGVFLDDYAGVVFTLYELQQELKRRGHGYNLNEIKKGLLICAKTGIDIRTKDGKNVLTSNIFETLGLQSKSEVGDGKGTQCYVRFNWLVTQCIRNHTYRQIDYAKYMSYKRVLSRWLHKRMAHTYKQANFLKPYSILLSTIIRDSGISVSRLRKSLQQVQKALNELVESDTIASYEEERRMDSKRKNKLADVMFTIFPSKSFVSDAISSNSLNKAKSQLRHSLTP